LSRCRFPIPSCRRWKQRDIHEKREARNNRIEQLDAEVACNDVLLTRLRAIQPKLVQLGSSYLSSEVDRLRTNPSPEAPPTSAAKPVPYDEMIMSLLQTIAKEAQEQAESDKGKLDKVLEERLEFHLDKLGGFTEERRNERDALLKEKSKHITMDDLHEGFESKVINSYHDSFFVMRTFSTLSTVHSCETRTCPSDKDKEHLQNTHRSAQPSFHSF
jgi:cell division cycle protein 37